MKNFKPLFKENDTEQFYFDGENWIKCGEDKINSLWELWVVSGYTRRFKDEDGFFTYGNIIENKIISS